MERVEREKTRHRSFMARTALMQTDGRSGVLSATGKPQISVSSPPEFNGNPGAWTPEELFVASVELCHMTTFLAYAEKEEVTVRSYQSHANGVMEFIDGEFRLTRIVIFATITVCRSTVEAAVHELLHEAQKHCLVANSIASIVEVNPTIILE